MQTLMPQIGFADSARHLDTKRLLRQIDETLRLLKCMSGETSNSVDRHDEMAIIMWQGCEYALSIYGMALCHELRIGRQYRCGQYVEIHRIGQQYANEHIAYPPWIGDKDFHRAVRSNLIRKAPLHYRDWPNTPENMPYLWPIPPFDEDVIESNGSPIEWQLTIDVADQERLDNGERKLPNWLVYNRDTFRVTRCVE